MSKKENVDWRDYCKSYTKGVVNLDGDIFVKGEEAGKFCGKISKTRRFPSHCSVSSPTKKNLCLCGKPKHKGVCKTNWKDKEVFVPFLENIRKELRFNKEEFKGTKDQDFLMLQLHYGSLEKIFLLCLKDFRIRVNNLNITSDVKVELNNLIDELFFGGEKK